MKNLIKSLKIQWKHKRIWLLLFLIPFIGISMDELSSKIDEEIWLLSNLYEDKLMGQNPLIQIILFNLLK